MTRSRPVRRGVEATAANDDVRREPGRQLYGVERVNALSDGLFAIVLTLLVLELKPPEGTDPGHILDDLADNHHELIAWVVSFIALARFWMVHHGIFARLARCHGGTILLNFVLLALVSLMPFTASLIGTYRVTEPWSTFFFASNLAATSVVLGLLARHVMREPQLLRADAEPATLEWHRRHHLIVLPTVAAIAGALAFLAPYLAISLFLVEFGFVVASASAVRRSRPGGLDGPAAAQRRTRQGAAAPPDVRSGGGAGPAEGG